MRTRTGNLMIGCGLIALACLVGRTRAQEINVEDAFTGHWRLVLWETFAADGTATIQAYSGRILYDGRGNMSAQLMPKGDDAEEGEYRRTRGYVAYFGTYAIDEYAGTVTHSVEGSNIFPWVGTDLVRHYEFVDGNLRLSLKDGERVTGSLTWERIE